MPEPLVGFNETENFEILYQQLEETVEQLESGGLSLDESITLYETGIRLAHRCKTMLDAAELRISELDQEFSLGMLDEQTEDEETEDEEPS